MAIDLKQAEDTVKQIQQSQNSGFQDPNKITQNSDVITTRMNANKDYYNNLYFGHKNYAGYVFVGILLALVAIGVIIMRKRKLAK